MLIAALRQTLYKTSRTQLVAIVKTMSSATSTDKRTWYRPEGSSELKLFNSLTKEKNEFVANGGKQVTWYSCGPTVYDASHMGHARSYITFDILRRVLNDYFNYDIFYVMNVTDVDDKIINRARKNYLVEQYKTNNNDNATILSDVTDSLENFKLKLEKTTDPDKKNLFEKIYNSASDQLEQFKIAATNGSNLTADKETLLQAAHDPLSDLLDSKYGATVTDHGIFTKLTQHWEEDFHQDMNSLNILPADVLTRVSQYIPEITAYIETIISNGFAYESKGSVYFDTLKFASSDGHEYAKLVPEAVGDLSALAEGEGDLSSPSTSDKHSDRDFALWKTSKPGEPFWESPWGKGRPGWHIECSVMASEVLGPTIDIHTGGVDLKFPHHDNELAQAEAYYCHKQWITYFLHAGHLTIEGCKMSKSLKNFISIKEALKRNTSRQIRLMFLLHAWNATLDYSVNVLKEATQVEKLFADFFLTVKDILRKPENTPISAHNYTTEEKFLVESFTEKKRLVHDALCDSVDTVSALQQMQALVKLTNIYIGNKKQSDGTPSHAVLGMVAKYLTKMLKVFGANEGDQFIGFAAADDAGATKREEVVMPFLDVLAQFREDVRMVAQEERATKILQLCDELRDDRLLEVGVRLEDQQVGAPVVKLVDREILLKEKQQKLDEIEKKRKDKEESKKKQLEEKAAKEAKARILPKEMFLSETDKYSKFDEQGMPTHDGTGEPLSASLTKKLKKLQLTQEKTYNKLLEQEQKT